jgi:hypothetical protein
VMLWLGALSWIVIVGPIEPIEWVPKEKPVASPVEAFAG